MTAGAQFRSAQPGRTSQDLVLGRLVLHMHKKPAPDHNPSWKAKMQLYKSPLRAIHRCCHTKLSQALWLCRTQTTSEGWSVSPVPSRGELLLHRCARIAGLELYGLQGLALRLRCSGCSCIALRSTARLPYHSTTPLVSEVGIGGSRALAHLTVPA